ncbi:hypothetical protein OCU04_001916 [Sclerotinia nivalis]|uniref:2EXR domain-containing protein n=1 Tax=Sclerotinia nivalis TaxID=352851 RepID=A0A9X0B0U5_9HELO|nr:hypothetical protein OCU04_001916 [Sclerotinia nivalis]
MELFSEGGNPFYPLSSRVRGDTFAQPVKGEPIRYGLESIGDWPHREIRPEVVQKAWLEATEISFARFSDLPTEVRILIWTLCCYMHGRIVFDKAGYADSWGPNSWFKENMSPNPGVIAACYESRAIALTHYHVLEGTANTSWQ